MSTIDPGRIGAMLAALALVTTVSAAGIVSSERVVTVDAFALDGYFDDADVDGDSVSSLVGGFFEECLDVTATGSLAAVNARAEQSSEIDHATGVFEATGFAAGSIYIQGIADTEATSAVRTTFDVDAVGGVTFTLINLIVNDVLDGLDAHDRPGDATATVRIVRTDDGAIAYELNLALDDLGTEAELLIEDPVDVPLAPGRYDLVIEAHAIDTTDGINQVEFSVATANFDVRGEIWAPCPGDADRDGQVTIDDILAVVLDFGYAGLSAPHGGDTDGSGVVDVDDILMVVLHFGDACE